MTPLVPVLACSLATMTAADPPARLLHGGRSAPRAWAAVAEGALWVCWDADEGPGCWSRIALELADDAADGASTLAFVSRSTLVVGHGDGASWVVRRSDPRPEPIDQLGLDGSSFVLIQPRSLGCSPTGKLPRRTDGDWIFVDAPCSAASVCVRPQRRGRRRRPTGARLDAGFEVGAGRMDVLTTEPTGTHVRSRAVTEVLVVVALRFDPALLRRQRRALASVRSAERSRAPTLPPVVDGPLAAAERHALRRALCPGGGP